MKRSDVIIGIRNLYKEWRFSKKAPLLPTRTNCDTWTMCFDVSRKIKVEMLIQVSDWDFIEMPIVYVRSIPEAAIERILPSPHLFLFPYVADCQRYYQLCYMLSNTNFFNKDNKLAIIDYCFNQSKGIITRLLTDRQYRAEDTMREIPVLWSQIAANNERAYKEHLHDASTLAIPPYLCHDDSTLLVTDDTPGYKFFNISEKGVRRELHCYVINVGSQYQPNILPSQFIAKDSMSGITFKTFKNWLAGLSLSASSQLESAIFSLIKHLMQKQLKVDVFIGCLIIDTETLCFKIDLSSLNRSFHDSQKTHLSKKKQIEILGQSRLFFIKSLNYTPHHVFERSIKNLEQPSLIGKKVLVIGCGAIGGYIALSLARLGAGAGEGVLHLVDNDTMSTVNIGRHVLGREYIALNKAEALKKEIKRQLFSVSVVEYKRSILNCLQLMAEVDLIIDATATPDISERINEAYHASDDITAPIIHAWIRNNGECVQSVFYEKSSDTACRSCINKSGEHIRTEYDALVGSGESITALQACTDFTPYAVSSSMSAAALVTDMVLDWLRGDISPTFRTRYSEKWHGDQLASSDAPAHHACHVCNL